MYIYNMSLTNPSNAVFGNQKFRELQDVDFRSYSGKANNLIVVDGTETGLNAVDAGSVLPSFIGSGPVGNIVTFSGTTPILNDSGLNITDFFGSKSIKPTLSTAGLRLDSDQGNINIKSGTGGFSGVFLDADTTSGFINLTSASQQLIAFNNISLSANSQLTIQAGGGAQILITPTGEISIRSAGAQNLSLQSNGGSSSWVFSGSSFSGGNLLFPTAPPVGECVLKVNSIDNLMYWDPVAPPP
jgi:hypothetical protein